MKPSIFRDLNLSLVDPHLDHLGIDVFQHTIQNHLCHLGQVFLVGLGDITLLTYMSLARVIFP